MSDIRDGKLLKRSMGVSLATFASRILGLLRVRLEAFALGGGTVASIWALTLAIPNLARRLLGEGALGTTLIPLVADEERDHGIPAARMAIAQVLSVLGVILALLVAIISCGAFLLGKTGVFLDSEFLQSDRVLGICELLPLIMPYAFFICLTGVISGVLNYAKIFVKPALTALFFNFCMIAGLGCGVLLKLPDEELLTLLAILTPAAGAIQFLLMLWMLRSCGKFPIFSRQTFQSFAITKKLFKLAAPGIIGYGVLQISFLIDRSLALYLGNQAVPALTYVDRIIDLPIGLFAVSLGSVLMSSMTHAASAGNWQEMNEQLNFSMRHVWFITAPMAAGVMFFHEDILGVLCLGGEYTLADLDAARYVAVFYGMGIPLFCSLKVILPAFHSRKDMKRPFYVSLTAVSVNIILNLILMFPMQQAGIALATVAASAVNNTLLLRLLAKDGFKLGKTAYFSIIRSVTVALVSAIAVWFIRMLVWQLFTPSFTARCCVLFIVGLSYLLFFLLFAKLSRAAELQEFFAILRRKKKKSV